MRPASGRRRLSDQGQASEDRRRLRTTFESTAGLYQQARPDYPDQLYDALIATAGIRPGDRLLEVGCATGESHASSRPPRLRRHCVEIGPELASAARRNLAAYREVTVIDGAFETWRPDDAAWPQPGELPDSRVEAEAA